MKFGHLKNKFIQAKQFLLILYLVIVSIELANADQTNPVMGAREILHNGNIIEIVYVEGSSSWQLNFYNEDNRLLEHRAFLNIASLNRYLLEGDASRNKNPQSWNPFIEKLVRKAQIKARYCLSNKDINHSEKWDNQNVRYQKGINNCHTFGSLSLVEAKFFDLTGKKIDLSEKDLFVQHLGPNLLETTMEKMATCAFQGESYNKSAPIAGSVVEDFGLVKENGVCREATRPYFSDNDYAGTLGQVLGVVGLNNKFLPLYEFEHQSEIVFDRLQDSCQRYQSNNNLNLNDFIHFARTTYSHLLGTTHLSRINIQALIVEQITLQCLKEREEVKNTLSNIGIKEVETNFEDILAHLQCNPVEISVRGYNQLIEGNLPNEDDLNNYTHAPVITGFDCETETFKIRNSWGYREEDRISADLLFSPGVLKDAHTLIGTDQATKTQCEKELPSKPVAERSWDEDEILKADFLRMSSDLQSKRNELSQLENTLEDIYRQERELARPTRSDNGKLVYWEENLQTRERMYLLRRQGHEGRIQLKNLEKEIRELNRRIAILSRRVIF